MCNRKVQKELKQRGYYSKFGRDTPDRTMITEERLNRNTEWGISDPTPRMAVDRMIAEQRAMVRAARVRVKAKSETTTA